jgi:hypothetical protein
MLICIGALTTGCAGRAAPFDKLDQAQVTVMRLQPKPQAPAIAPGIPGIPGFQIPGFDPALVNQTLEQLKAAGLPIPPGLIPGGAPAPGQPAAQPYMNDPNFVITDQRPIVDESQKETLLDLFGDDGAYNEQVGNCWFPGMVVSFQGSPDYPQPVDVAVSLSCNQVNGYGFQWPHANRGLTAETHQTLTQIYQSLFGPVPPQA